jgi:hypothetical protein
MLDQLDMNKERLFDETQPQAADEDKGEGAPTVVEGEAEKAPVPVVEEEKKEAKAVDPRELAALALERKAHGGDVSAIKAIAEGVADRLRGVDASNGGGEPLPPHVASAMIEAGLAAIEGRDPEHVPPPDPWAWYHASTPAPGFHRPTSECPTCGRPADYPDDPPRRYGPPRVETA